MTYKEATTYLFDSVPMFQNVGGTAYKEGLSNTLLLDEHFGHPHRKFRTIHVGGTNGKGSCSHTLAAILQTAGYKVGLYTSPHLTDFRERIRVNGKMIPECEVVSFVEDERSFFEPLHPSFFELTTALAFKYFAKAEVDVAVIEVGMGGRLDCTNIITPDLSVITNISFDHVQFLGDTLTKIAGEKAGIIRPEVPVFFAQTAPGSDSVIEKTAEKEGCFCKKIGKDAYEILGIEDKHIAFSCASAYYGTTTWKLNNIGTYQPGNALLAMEVMRYLFKENGHPQEWRTALARVKWAGRMEEILPKVYVDGAHNVSAIQAFVRSVPKNPDGNIILFSAVKDKEYEEMISYLCKHADAEEYVVTLIDGDRATDAHILGELFRKYTEQPVTVIESVKEAMQYVLRIQGRRTVYCLGSLYLTGMIKEIIQESLSGCGEV